MNDHDGKFAIPYSWYVAACLFCMIGGFLAGRWS